MGLLNPDGSRCISLTLFLNASEDRSETSPEENKCWIVVFCLSEVLGADQRMGECRWMGAGPTCSDYNTRRLLQLLPVHSIYLLLVFCVRSFFAFHFSASRVVLCGKSFTIYYYFTPFWIICWGACSASTVGALLTCPSDFFIRLLISLYLLNHSLFRWGTRKRRSSAAILHLEDLTEEKRRVRNT